LEARVRQRQVCHGTIDRGCDITDGVCALTVEIQLYRRELKREEDHHCCQPDNP
jgi:hypothetical protein